MADTKKFWILLLPSLLLAFFGWTAPSHQMPLDYGAMIWRSIPYAIAWTLVITFALVRFRTRGALVSDRCADGSLLADLAALQSFSILLLLGQLPIEFGRIFASPLLLGELRPCFPHTYTGTMSGLNRYN
jgi:hypothetical protein